MGVDPRFTNLYQQTRQLENDMHAVWNDAHHTDALALQNKVRRFREDIESGNGHDHLQVRADEIHKDLEKMYHHGTPLIGENHLQGLTNRARDIHHGFRSF